ncbi:MAG TPA: discoidin domain-containing protein [Polyangiaceae bacterium]|nr:discoidin domain-containing protein [Polyangiaceae bacterium]
MASEDFAPLPLEVAKPARQRVSSARAFFSWFWLGAAIAQERARAAGNERYQWFAKRARETNAAAHAVTEAREIPGAEAALPLACELFRQSAHWSLAALNSLGSTSPVDAASVGASARLWNSTDRDLLVYATGGPATFLEMQAVCTSPQPLAAIEQRSLIELGRLHLDLRLFSDRLLELVESPRRRLSTLKLKRALRLALPFLVLVVVAGGALAIADYREKKSDLTLNKPWTTSSNANVGGCPSPHQVCSDEPPYFFHTAEEATPWIEIDLGREESFHGIRIHNRTDCCRERAVPLVVEVSNDRSKYSLVARQESNFRRWKQTFAPTKARYVRVRALKRTMLHLSRIMVLP